MERGRDRDTPVGELSGVRVQGGVGCGWCWRVVEVIVVVGGSKAVGGVGGCEGDGGGGCGDGCGGDKRICGDGSGGVVAVVVISVFVVMVVVV